MSMIVRPLADVSANGASAAVDTGESPEGAVQVFGTFNATVAVEASLLESGGDESFSQIGSNLTAKGFVRIPYPVKRVRILVSSYSSGTVQARYTQPNRG